MTVPMVYVIPALLIAVGAIFACLRGSSRQMELDSLTALLSTLFDAAIVGVLLILLKLMPILVAQLGVTLASLYPARRYVDYPDYIVTHSYGTMIILGAALFILIRRAVIIRGWMKR